MDLVVFISWLILSIVAGIIASNKGRSGIGYFFLSILLSPLIGIIVALVVSPITKNVEAQQLASGNKKCPFCAEIIKAEAKVCRYCGRDLQEEEIPKPKVKVRSSPTSNDDYIPVEEFAKQNGIRKPYIIEQIRNGSYDGYTKDGQWYINKSEE